MAVTKHGIYVPESLDRSEESEWDMNTETGMEYELWLPQDSRGAWIGVSHDAVGLVTWWLADTLAEARAFVARGMAVQVEQSGADNGQS